MRTLGTVVALTALTALTALVGPLLSATPADASPPPPVASVTVSSSIRNPARVTDDFTDTAVVSWTGEDSSTQSVRVCLVTGQTASQDPQRCDLSQDVYTPYTQSQPFELRPSRAYSVSVFTASAYGEYSPPVSMGMPGSKLSVATTHQLTYGDQIVLHEQLLDATSAAPVPDKSLTLLHWPPGSHGWQSVASATTDQSGRADLGFRPRERGTYAWVYRGDGGRLAASVKFTVGLAYRLTGRLTSGRAAPGSSVKLYGIVRPRTSGKVVYLDEYVTSPCPGMVLRQQVKAREQRLPDGRTSFGYVMTIAATSPGTHKFHTFTEGDRHLDTGHSPTRSLVVSAAARGTSRATPSGRSC
jgi:hypothetical protein